MTSPFHVFSLLWITLIYLPGSLLQLPPVIRKQPIDGFVAKDKAHTLWCNANGSLPISIIWYKDGQRVSTQHDNPVSYTSLLENGNLFFLQFQPTDAGLYYCSAANSFGLVLSRNASLQLASIKDEFRVAPSSLSVVADQTAKLLCSPPRGVPEPQTQWRLNGTVLNQEANARISIESSGNLIIQNVQRVDQGSYVCEGKNEAGVRTSEAAFLKVLELPEIVQSPEDKIVNQGNDVSLSCKARGDPAPGIIWTKVNDRLDSARSVVTKDNSLVISRVDASDEGSYRCTATSTAGESHAEAYLVVYTPPVFLQKPTSKTVGRNTVVLFRCVAGGNPPPILIWEKEQADLLLYVRQTQGRFSVLEDGSLKIANCLPEDDGEYKCTAVNSAGRNITTASLRVRDKADTGPAPIITETPQNISVFINQNAELQCKASGNPSPTIRWMHNKRPVLYDTRISINRGNLRMTDVMVTDSGEYTCVAISESGDSEASAFLNVVGVINTVVETLLPAPPGKPEVSSDFTAESTIKVHWLSNTHQTNMLVSTTEAPETVYYTVEYFTRQNKKGWIRVPQPTTNTWMQIDNLKTGLSYVVLVRARNKYGTSEPSPLSEYIKIPGNFPSTIEAWSNPEIKANLERINIFDKRADVLSSTAVNVTWKVSEDDMVFIEGFHVRLASPTTADTYITYSCFSTYIIVSNLMPYTSYTVSIVPFYHTTSAAPSAFLSAFTKEDVPSGPPQMFELKDGPRYVTLSWTPPKVIHRNGEINGYVIICKADDHRYSRNFTVNATVLNVALDNLNRITAYNIGVAAMTKAGVGVVSTYSPLKAIANKSNEMVWWHIVIGVAAAVGIFLIILVVCIYRRHKGSKKSKAEDLPMNSNLTGAPYQSTAGDLITQHHQERLTFPPTFSGATENGADIYNNLDNYSNPHDAAYFKTIYRSKYETGPYATTVIPSCNPHMTKDESLADNSAGKGNLYNSCNSSCTDNNIPKDSSTNESNNTAEILVHEATPMLPSFVDMLPPPPVYPPPDGEMREQYYRTNNALYNGCLHCQTCNRGYQLGQPNNQYAARIPGHHMVMSSPDYQLIYPNPPRSDGSSHHYQTYAPSIGGHSSESHEYAEPQLYLHNHHVYNPGRLPHTMQPANQYIPSTFHPVNVNNQHAMVKHQMTLPHHHMYHQKPRAGLGHRQHSVPVTFDSPELCHTCADNCRYSDYPAGDWPVQPGHHIHVHPSQHTMYQANVEEHQGQGQVNHDPNIDKHNISDEEAEVSSERESFISSHSSPSNSEQNYPSKKKHYRHQRSQQMLQSAARSSSPHDSDSTDSFDAPASRKPYSKSPKRRIKTKTGSSRFDRNQARNDGSKE